VAKNEVTDAAIGALIRAKRHERGLGQPELADALGVSSMMIQHYETGRNSLSILKLVKIAETLKCKTTDLIP
jgi:transcriptional regulator with XRE-family HTH domain